MLSPDDALVEKEDDISDRWVAPQGEEGKEKELKEDEERRDEEEEEEERESEEKSQVVFWVGSGLAATCQMLWCIVACLAAPNSLAECIELRENRAKGKAISSVEINSSACG